MSGNPTRPPVARTFSGGSGSTGSSVRSGQQPPQYSGGPAASTSRPHVATNSSTGTTASQAPSDNAPQQRAHASSNQQDDSPLMSYGRPRDQAAGPLHGGRAQLHSTLHSKGPPAAAMPTANGTAAAADAGVQVFTLPTHGDLFAAPDQSRGAICRAISGTSISIPAWNQERPHLTGLHLLHPAAAAAGTAGAAEEAPLSGLPSSAQEQMLVNDLLYAFMGLDAKYVRVALQERGPGCARGPRLGYKVAALEPCLQEQVARLLPIAEAVATIGRFVETRSGPEYSIVAQALAAAMRGLLQEWLLMVTQLEHTMRKGQLGMQALLYHCQAPMASLRLLAGISAEAASKELSSVGILNLLHSKAASLAGDRSARALVQQLLEASAAPYFEMLEAWLCGGVLDDPYGEFMIQEDTSVTKETLMDDQLLAYWHLRYTIRKDTGGAGADDEEGAEQLDVPLFLRDAADAILTTGKYLNAIRECGQPVVRPLAPGVCLTYDAAGSYLGHIHAALEGASAALLAFMMRDSGLVAWLRSLKHYFLLDQGDLLVHVMEVAKEELAKPAKAISRPRLQSLLELAIKTSSIANDPHQDDVSFTLDPRTLMDLVRASLNQTEPGVLKAAAPTASNSMRLLQRGDNQLGWQLFLLTFRVSWPHSLVVSKRQLTQYQLIFKHLFSLKFLERKLASVWALLQPTRRLSREQQDAFKLWHSLCSSLMHFIQEYLRFITFDVLEPQWGAMEAGMRKANNIDEVIRCHQAFLTRALDGALLSKPSVLLQIGKLERCAQDFCDQAQVLAAGQVEAEAQPTGPAASFARIGSFARVVGPLKHLAADTAQAKVMSQLHERFGAALGSLVSELSAHYNALLTRTPAGSAQMESSREELESLLNLIERISLGRGSAAASRQGGLAGAVPLGGY